ncbi:protein FAM217A isoform X2 [Tupaia chinensis]|uniref:protein FAM217A isoform X2 n=1 Tax=Tupaia chinensis TaxID=246437 RepID=UPI0003C8F055|nr:protein FAM217A isoform X2 [Tupaia chinensis]
MSRLTQRAVVSPEQLPLASWCGGCDKLSWLPEGKVFSNVQRDKIISKFLKESVLKRVFRSQQMRWEGPDCRKEDRSRNFPCTRKQAEPGGAPGLQAPHADGPGPRGGSALGEDSREDAWACGAVRILRKQRSSYHKMGRRTGEKDDTGPRVSNVPHENHLEIPVQQLMLELNLSEHAHKRTQNGKQGIFQLWSYPVNEGSAMENREFKKSSTETGFNVTNNSTRFFTPSHSFDKQVGSYPGLLMPFDLCWPYADGDFFKDRNELHMNSCSIVENNNGETLSAPNWNLKYGNSSVEENATDESDLSENEKANDTLLSYFKRMDLNLKPETIDNVEESFTEEPNEVFPYPDFLPPPFSALDLHKLALSKSEAWKATVEPPESTIEHLVTRLLELERLQHATIQKERPKPQTTLCTPAVTERPSSSKAISKVKQPKFPDSSSLQTSCIDKSRDKRKNSPGSCKLEQNASKWNWSNAEKSKWNSRPPSLKSSPTTKQFIATYDDLKNAKGPILNPCQELSSKSPVAQTTPSLVKMVSRCPPPRSPIPVSPVPLCFPETQREEVKPRPKKKLYRKNTVLHRPFYIQKLNCLSSSFIAKDKCSLTKNS